MSPELSSMDLDSGKVAQTIERLCLRIEDRFPGSGLSKICRRLHDISRETEHTIALIPKPIIPLRVGIVAVVLGFAALLAFTVGHVPLGSPGRTFVDFIGTIECSVNVLILLALGFVYLVSLEMRLKRQRVTRAMRRLRNVAHVVDMHQLTKDPDRTSLISQPTKHSPQRTMTPYELGRYLGYCSEMLSLVGKLGYLYVSRFHDPTANKSANDLESLTTGLCRKIWQKIIILRSGFGEAPEA